MLSLGIGIKNITLFLISRYGFLNLSPPAYLDPPLIKFSRFLPSTISTPPFIRNCRVSNYTNFYPINFNFTKTNGKLKTLTEEIIYGHFLGSALFFKDD